jgi:energy-coupling factor transporter transmembrane protein EcfT
MTKTEVYVNPANGHRADAYGACLFTLLFGTFYFLVKGIWRHVLIQLFLIVFMFTILPPRSIVVAVVGMMLFYASIAKKIVVSHYMRRGYVPESSYYSPKAEPGATPSVPDDLWAKALAECESAERQEGLWARVFAQARGDENKAKAAYTAQRVIEFAETPSPEKQHY